MSHKKMLPPSSTLVGAHTQPTLVSNATKVPCKRCDCAHNKSTAWYKLDCHDNVKAWAETVKFRLAKAYICSACYNSLTTKVRSVGLARRRNSVPTTGTLFYPIHTPKGA